MARKEVLIGVKFDKESKDKLKTLADRRDIPVGQLIREAVRKHLLSADSSKETSNGQQ